MNRRVIAVIASVILLPLCSGASCRQETAQSAMAVFFNTVAEVTAQQLVSNAAKAIPPSSSLEIASGVRP